MKNFYILFTALVVFFTPLSMWASEASSTRILGDEKYPMLGCEVIDSCVPDVTPRGFSSCPTNIVKTPTTASSCWTINWSPFAVADDYNITTITQTTGPTNGSCLSSGTYSVNYKVTDTKGNVGTCTFVITVNSYSSDSLSEVERTSKISEVTTITSKGNSDIRLFPNPATDVLSVDLTKYNGLDVTISLYNLFGEQVLTQEVGKVSGNVVNLDVSKNQAGNYWLRVVAKGRKDAVKQVHIAK